MVLTGPCGADAWYIESHEEDDPMEIVKRLSTNLMGAPLLVHSTSWRRGPGGVFLSFLVVIGDDQAPDLASIPITRADLARNTATEASPPLSSMTAAIFGYLARSEESTFCVCEGSKLETAQSL